jgi:hypothetical protein
MITRPPSKLQRTITVDDLDNSELLYSQLLDANDSPKFNPAAQSAADLDNLHSAFQHLDSSHPVAINTDKAMAYVKSKLFPDPPTNNNFPCPLKKPLHRLAFVKIYCLMTISLFSQFDKSKPVQHLVLLLTRQNSFEPSH